MPRGRAGPPPGLLRAGGSSDNERPGYPEGAGRDTWSWRRHASTAPSGALGARDGGENHSDSEEENEKFVISRYSEDSSQTENTYGNDLHFPPTLAREWNPRSSDITAAERAEAALGAFLISLLTLPVFYLILFEVVARYGERLAARSERDIIISFMVTSGVACFFFLYSCIIRFRGRRTLDPAWTAPRLALFLEVHPILGFCVPITSYLRGYIGFSLFRWLLNVGGLVLFVLGHTVLRPAYLEACCYGENFLRDSAPGGSCQDRTARSNLGFSVCDPDGMSDDHKFYNKLGTAFLVLSATMQLLNICTVDWDVINRIGQLQREITKGGLRIETQEGKDEGLTINLRLIMQLLGLPRRLEAMCFPGYVPPSLTSTTNPFELIKRRQKRLHEHPHWAHPGLLRLLCLDPIFGFLLSVHDFTAYHDLRGAVRVFFNIFGGTLCFLSIEVLQPMHQAWCCYGKGHEIWEEHVNGTSFTCLEWADLNVEGVFYNSRDFPNGECMRYDGIGYAASVAFAVGLAMLIFSTMLWTYTYVAVESSCERIAHKCMRLVRPSERLLLLQVFDWVGIKHGKIKLY